MECRENLAPSRWPYYCQLICAPLRKNIHFWLFWIILTPTFTNLLIWNTCLCYKIEILKKKVKLNKFAIVLKRRNPITSNTHSHPGTDGMILSTDHCDWDLLLCCTHVSELIVYTWFMNSFLLASHYHLLPQFKQISTMLSPLFSSQFLTMVGCHFLACFLAIWRSSLSQK